MEYPYYEDDEEELVYKFTNDFDWYPREETSKEVFNSIYALPWGFLIENPDLHCSVLQHMIKRGCGVKQFNEMIGESIFSSKLIVPFGLVLTCIDWCKWAACDGDLEEGDEWAPANNAMECLEYFLDLAPEAVESADPSTGELIIQKLHQISSVHSSDITFHAFKLLIKAGMRPGSSLIADRAGLYRLTDVGESSSVPSQPVISVIMEGMKGGIDVISFLTKSDPPLLTAADICDIDIVSFLMESYTHENWESTNDFFLEVMDSLLQLEPRAVKSAIKMLPDFNEHFLGEIVKIFVDAGLRIGLGGEYGIGGLFLPSGTSENDFLFEDIDFGGHEESVLRKLAETLPRLHESPILHAAVRGKSDFIKHMLDTLIRIFRGCVVLRDSVGRVPLHWACDSGCEWVSDRDSWTDEWQDEDWQSVNPNMPDGYIRGGVIGLVQASPDLVSLIDPVTGLYPYQLVCAGETTDLDSSYRLLRACPTALTNTS